MADLETLRAKLAPFDQQHVLRFWDELSNEGRERLAAQLEDVDPELIAQVHGGDAEQPDWAALAKQAVPPPAMRLSDRQQGKSGGLGVTPDQAQQRGRQALDAGEVGVLLVAGGQGSRLGFDHPKGMYPIGPISDATLLQIHLEKAVALAKRHGVSVPVYLMTSPVTHDEQVAFLKEHDNFGLADDDLVVFCQGTMPAIDAQTGKLLMAAKDSLFLSPDGHGGTVAALAKSGAIDHMNRRGVKHLFYLQVDNPIVPIGDAELIGYHLLAESELTSMAVAKETPGEKLGNFAMIDDRMTIIEYSDMPDDVAELADASGGLKFWAGSIAVHVFGVAFLERMLGMKDSLPLHIAHKKVPHVDASGELVEPTENNALKLEKFIFDLLPKANNPIVVEYAEDEVFAPLKNAPGAPKDTEEYVQRFMMAQHRGWLAAAGVDVPADAPVEISPLWGLDAEGVKVKADGVKIDGPTYLR
ncbi:putative uridylyltransferase [Posidoniimonas polymericola]|uniref:Putative uridylyltransferase n=1 Tax=Posidoniimonas polymericola TaxID=2528002 RepID=A0A5C5YS82_9BACT|nr:UDPGP type 1 family protein [Posidoniimonas polymericola]TWT77726.1 putative uridylyltransferase [Posidoniimonas polymericola]